MGVGLISKYRYSIEGNGPILQSEFQRQIDTYLPDLQGVKVIVSEKGKSYFITAQVQNILYGISFDTESMKIITDTKFLSDL